MIGPEGTSGERCDLVAAGDTKARPWVTVHAVLACFNRRSETQQCLATLFAQSVAEELSIRAFVVDDAFTEV
jgi:hypothetical protein